MTIALIRAVTMYLEAGWEIVPLPAGAKAPVPAGLTGYKGKAASPARLEHWIENGFRAKDPDSGRLRTFPAGGIAIRLPAGVLGIDVDAYDGKPGEASLQAFTERWGPLPPGPVSTARRAGGDLVSGIRLLRVPEGRSWQANPAPGIELITRTHRFAVVWPSVHRTGQPYLWYNAAGEVREHPPLVIQLPWLDDRWAAGLSRAGGGAGGARGAEGAEGEADGRPGAGSDATAAEIEAAFREWDGSDCPGAWKGLEAFLRSRAAEGSSRHDACRSALRRAMEEARAGAYPAREAAEGLRRAFGAAAGGERAAGGEFGRMLAHAVGRALAMSDRDLERVGAELLKRSGGPPSEGEQDLLSVTQSEKIAKTRTVIPGHQNPMGVARAFAKRSQRCGVTTLVNWRGDFYRWDGAQWNDADVKFLKDELYHWLEGCWYARERATKANPGLPATIEPWVLNVVTVSRVLDALASAVAIPWEAEPGMWLDLSGSRFRIPGKPSFKVAEPPAEEPARSGTRLLSVATPFIALSSGILDVRTRVLNKPHPTYFNLSSIQFSFRVPIEERTGTLVYQCPGWLRFLKSVWNDDAESIRLLQQWFGYVLSGDTSFQKMMLLVGPKRSGKGTISRVLRALMTPRNVASPTADSLGDRFGLSSLIGKSLAIVGDARFEGRGIQTTIERLLSISGEDAIDIDRKNRAIWNGRLGTRFMIITNKVPELGDASGAIASRFLVLEMLTSWLGREDRGLEARLMAELPGILFWALDGLYDLDEEDRFLVPESAAEAHETMEELGSPHAAFAEEMCETGPLCEIPCAELYQAWRRWCELNGLRYPGGAARFGRDLRASVTGLSRLNRGADGGRVRTYQGICLREDPDDEGALPGLKDIRRKS